MRPFAGGLSTSNEKFQVAPKSTNPLNYYDRKSMAIGSTLSFSGLAKPRECNSGSGTAYAPNYTSSATTGSPSPRISSAASNPFRSHTTSLRVERPKQIFGASQAVGSVGDATSVAAPSQSSVLQRNASPTALSSGNPFLGDNCANDSATNCRFKSTQVG